MKKIEAQITPSAKAFSIWQKLKDNSFKSYFCGGCVRDYLLGVEPKDWDITTYAIPEDIERIFPKTVDVGRSFGVMIVVLDGEEFEVATLRTDSVFGDGRRPSGVFFSNAEEDVKRRDFTVNGLLYDPESFEIIDYVGGIADLEKKIIRAIGEPGRRFKEDYLRMIRAVRFAARLGFEIENETLRAIRKNAGFSVNISAERIADELSKMLICGRAGEAVRLLDKCFLLEHILPEVKKLQGVEQPPEFHPEGDVWTHTLMMLDSLPKDCDLRLAFAVLLHDVGKPDTIMYEERIKFHSHDSVGAELTEGILRRLKRSREFIEEVTMLVKRHMRMMSLKDMRTAKLRRTLRDPLFPLHLKLHRLDCVASHNKLDIYEFAKKSYEEEMAIPDPVENVITGKDLIAMGYKPSKSFSEIISQTQDEYLEGRISNLEEAKAFVRKNFPLPQKS